jgi:hypothetical protein
MTQNNTARSNKTAHKATQAIHQTFIFCLTTTATLRGGVTDTEELVVEEFALHTAYCVKRSLLQPEVHPGMLTVP